MEKVVEQYLRQQVKKAGGLALKFVSPGFTGVPDRIILMPGARVYFAETKDRGQKPEPRQRRVHKFLRDLGFMVFVPDTKTAVDNMMIWIVGDGWARNALRGEMQR